MAAWQKDQVGGRTFAACADDWDRSTHPTGGIQHLRHVPGAAALGKAKNTGGRKIQDIGPDEIDAYINHIAGQGYSRRGVQVYLDMFRMIWNFSIVRGMGEKQSCGPVKLPAGLSDGERSAYRRTAGKGQVRSGEREWLICYMLLLYRSAARGAIGTLLGGHRPEEKGDPCDKIRLLCGRKAYD